MYPKLSAIAYWELQQFEDEVGYYYYIQLRDRDYHITQDGVSVSYIDGITVKTNISPIGLFGKKDQLDDDDLIKIVTLPIEGKVYSLIDMNAQYKEYKNGG